MECFLLLTSNKQGGIDTWERLSLNGEKQVKELYGLDSQWILSKIQTEILLYEKLFDALDELKRVIELFYYFV